MYEVYQIVYDTGAKENKLSVETYSSKLHNDEELGRPSKGWQDVLNFKRRKNY